MSKMQHIDFKDGPQHLTPAEVASYHVRNRTGQKYASEAEVLRSSDSAQQVGLLQLILESLTAKPEKMTPIEIHGYWLREHYDRAVSLVKRRDQHLRRLAKIFDISIIRQSACEEITVERMAKSHRNGYINYGALYSTPSLMIYLDEVVQILSRINKPEDCSILKGVGKKKLEKIIASAKERKAAKSE